MCKTGFLLAFCFLAFTGAAPGRAWADSKMNLIQITCNKNLNYLTLRTLQLSDRDYVGDDDKEKESEVASGLYRPSSLVGHPYTCDIGHGSVVVEVIDFRSTGACGGGFDILIKANGSDVYKFKPYVTTSPCVTSAYHFIDILFPYSLKDCLIPDGTNEPASCSYPTK